MKCPTKFAVALAALAFCAPTIAADTSAGRRDYEHNCAMCHGVTGKGNGWLTQYLLVPVPSITELKKNNAGVFPAKRVYQVIDGTTEVKLHGSRSMPVWGRTFQLDEVARKFSGSRGDSRASGDVVRARIRALVDYIATLQE
ncbi:MAG: cytochrome c [Betaproteobacteria bacterium]|nr:cytochrome c [Betaproteobacteria bacterium]MBI2961432.1 cytochrome c [Betaproteobacteria bacterium]